MHQSCIYYLDTPEKKKKQHEMGVRFACQIPNERGIYPYRYIHDAKGNEANHMLKRMTSKAEMVVAPGQRKKSSTKL
jgi:hypothetical protein